MVTIQQDLDFDNGLFIRFFDFKSCSSFVRRFKDYDKTTKRDMIGVEAAEKHRQKNKAAETKRKQEEEAAAKKTDKERFAVEKAAAAVEKTAEKEKKTRETFEKIVWLLKKSLSLRRFKKRERWRRRL